MRAPSTRPLRRRLVPAALVMTTALLAACGSTGPARPANGASPRPSAQHSASGSPPRVVATDQATYARLVAANYKILSAAQSQRLLRFARAEHDCLAAHSVAVGEPQAWPTRIVMSLPTGSSLRAVGKAGLACARAAGDPPAGSALQLRPGQVLVYLPKYCVLDRKTVSSSESAKSAN